MSDNTTGNRRDRSRQMLLDEPPLVVLPSLAVAIGLGQAIIVQQIHYWIEKKRMAGPGEKGDDKADWVYNSYEGWARQFPFFSTVHIRRMLNDLEKKGILVCANFNNVKSNRTKWYTIDYEKLNLSLEQQFKKQEEKRPGHELGHDQDSGESVTQPEAARMDTSSDQNDQMKGPEWPDDVIKMISPCDQNDQSICSKRSVHVIKMISPCDQNDQMYYTETTTETNPETTTETNPEKNPPRAHTHDAHTPARVREDIEHVTDKDFHPSSPQTSSSVPVDGGSDPAAIIPSLSPEEKEREISSASTENCNNTPTSQPQQSIPPSSPPSEAPPSSQVEAAGEQAPEDVAPPASEDAAPPRKKTLIDVYHDAVVAKYGIKPVIHGPKEGMAVKRALKYASEEVLQDLVNDYVNSGRWEREGSPELSIILSARNINAFNLAKAKAAAGMLPLDGHPPIPFDEIVGYLNTKAGSSYKPTDPATMRMIEARWTEGYRLEDFQKVVDNMTAKWGKDARMMNFLRPATLFSEKFGNYLGAVVTPVDLGIMSRTGYESSLVLDEWIVQKRQELRAREKSQGDRSGIVDEPSDSCERFDDISDFGEFGMDLSGANNDVRTRTIVL